MEAVVFTMTQISMNIHYISMENIFQPDECINPIKNYIINFQAVTKDTVNAEEIDGYRGDEDLDRILEFIEAKPEKSEEEKSAKASKRPRRPERKPKRSRTPSAAPSINKETSAEPEKESPNFQTSDPDPNLSRSESSPPESVTSPVAATSAGPSKPPKPVKAPKPQNLGTLISSYITSAPTQSKQKPNSKQPSPNSGKSNDSGKPPRPDKKSSERKSSISSEEIISKEPGLEPATVTEADQRADSLPPESNQSRFEPENFSNNSVQDKNSLPSDTTDAGTEEHVELDEEEEMGDQSVQGDVGADAVVVNEQDEDNFEEDAADIDHVMPDADDEDDVIDDEDDDDDVDVEVVDEESPSVVAEVKAVPKRDDHQSGFNYESILKFIKHGKDQTRVAREITGGKVVSLGQVWNRVCSSLVELPICSRAKMS